MVKITRDSLARTKGVGKRVFCETCGTMGETQAGDTIILTGHVVDTRNPQRVNIGVAVDCPVNGCYGMMSSAPFWVDLDDE